MDIGAVFADTMFLRVENALVDTAAFALLQKAPGRDVEGILPGFCSRPSLF